MNKINSLRMGDISPNGIIPDLEEHRNHEYPYHMGVELELENVTYPHGRPAVPAGWTTHVDQSLRNGIEYVTSGPMSGVKLKRAITTFYAMGITTENTPRTSTHIHVNASDLTLGQVRTMFALSHVLESALFEIIGNARKYCGYCMPLSEMAPSRMKSILVSDKWNETFQAMQGRNEDKYYGFNISSIRKHGTVEFRYFYGGPTKDELSSWLDYCTSIKKLATSMTLQEFLSIDSPESLAAILHQFMGAWAERIIGLNGPEHLYDVLQDLCAMFPDENLNIREDDLVFVSEPLLKVLSVTHFPKKKSKSFDEFFRTAKELRVLSSGAWNRMLNDYQHRAQREQYEEEDAGLGPIPVKQPRYKIDPLAAGAAVSRRSLNDLLMQQINAVQEEF